MRCRPSVLNRPPEVFYRNHLLKPYVFFDVAGGRDFRDTAGSRRNQACAFISSVLLLCQFAWQCIQGGGTLTSEGMVCAMPGQRPSHQTVFIQWSSELRKGKVRSVDKDACGQSMLASS